MMSMLEMVPFFNGLDESALEQITRLSFPAKRDDGAFFFLEGATDTKLYLLTEGKVKLGQVTSDGQQVIFHYLHPGEMFGLVAMLEKKEGYPIAAQAVGACQAMVWDEEALRQMRRRWPELCHNALEYLAHRLNNFQVRLRELATERVERRIARTLVRLANQTGRKTEAGVLIDFPITRQDLAEMTGTTRYTVSRTLKKWEEQGLIQSKREQIVICHPHGLVVVAEDL